MSMRRPLLLSALMLAAVSMIGCGGSGETSATSEIVDIERAPLADAVSISMEEGTSISTATSASDDDGDPLSFVLIDPPEHGYLNFFSATGRFTYTPLAGFTGVDHFSYRAFDGQLYSNVAGVDIRVEPPRIVIVYG